MNFTQRMHADVGIRVQRSVPFRGELRSAPDGAGGESLTFLGYATVYDSPYTMSDFLGDYTEVVRAGAARKTLSEGADVPFLLNHAGHTLARTKSGTMALAEDSTGLHVEAQLSPVDPVVQSIRSAMERGDMDEMSMAFWVTDQEWSPDWMQREIKAISLHKGDVSLVNYGANPATAGSSLRSLDERVDALSPDERRELFDRLAAEFADPITLDVNQPGQAPKTLRLFQARSRAL